MARVSKIGTSMLVTIIFFTLISCPILQTEATRFQNTYKETLVKRPICPACVCCEPPPHGSCCRCCSVPSTPSASSP
ncbi:hypothetical protein Leryth_021986 [Lithospermum erythrorhizon]|nr:hypothetical protein Leryth_021986 [Lithospermum erythrorhizon]